MGAIGSVLLILLSVVICHLLLQILSNLLVKRLHDIRLATDFIVLNGT